MPRTREFNETEVLERAMETFWSKGYEATSLQDLISAMGISKSSFYETFGSKHELLLSAIENYVETQAQDIVRLLDGEPSGKKAVEKLFIASIECDGQGCFLCNCAVEISQRDPAAAAIVIRGMERIEEAFYRAVVRGQEAGEISTSRDARALARYLVNSENGLMVMAKANREREVMADIVKTVLSVLE